MIHDSSERYGRISKLLHWGMAALIGWQLLKFGDRIADGEHWIGLHLVSWHVSIGSLLLLLIVLRIAWALGQRNHRPRQNPATAVGVRFGHFLLYATMLLLPVTGVLGRLGRGRGLTAFGLQILPPGDKMAWAEQFASLHSPLAWALAALVLGHVAMALVHHFFHRDDVLRRML